MMNRNELFNNAIRENGELISRICSRFFASKQDAQDAYQEILLKIWLNIQNFRGDSLIKTWISRIAVNVCITFVSKTKKKFSLFVPFSKKTEQLSIQNDGEPISEKDEKLDFLTDFVSSLSAPDKALVALYLEDMDTKEIAQITGFSDANVRVRIHRIKKEIKLKWELKNGLG